MKNKGLFAYYFLDHQSIEIGSKTFPNKSFFARKFELESLHNLKVDLERLNIPLIIDQVGSDHLATLIDRYSIESLYSIDFATSNERNLSIRLSKRQRST
jgi:deoxyribodipyrimidine photolyase